MQLLYFVFAFLAYLTYKVISSLVKTWQLKKFAKQHGCEEPLDISGPLPWAWKRFYRMLNLEKNADFLDAFIAPDFDEAATVKLTAFEGTQIISTVEPANLQALLATQFKDFETGSARYHAFEPLLGNSIFSSDGAFWEHSRALFRPQFSRENINDLEMTARASEDLIAAIGSTDQEGCTKDTEMMPLLYNFTLDTATDFLFGESIDSQRAATAVRNGNASENQSQWEASKVVEASEFARCFSVIQSTLVTRIRAQSLYWFGDGLEFRKAIRVVRQFTEYFVNLATSTAASTEKVEIKKNSLLNNLATQTQDRTELRNQTLAILLAGRDTTSSMLGWCFAQLSLNPQIFNKLRNIILRDFPANEEITFTKLKSCRYLQHVLNEVLRLHPTVPVNQRIATKDTTLPTGGGPSGNSPVAIAKGQAVLFSVYVMHRRTDLWGADALEFRPERWDEKRYPAWQFLPFLGGPRICLGQQFALTEASYLLVKVLREFDAIEPVDWTEMRRMKKGLGVTMWPGDGARVRFRKAKTQA